MYHVSWIREYPIYEPAEGGYYYEGEDVVACRSFSTWKKAKKLYLKWKKEFTDYYGTQEETNRVFDNPRVYRVEGPFITYYGNGYVGTGARLQITRHEPQNRGWRPYC